MHKARILRRFSALLIALGGCGGGDPTEPLIAVPQPAGFAETAAETAPPQNLLTESRAQLGKRLFFEAQLSSDGTVSCSSCHQQEHGFADPRPVSVGVEGRQGKRNASHLTNLAWVRTGLFWDGRAATLEEQVGMPIEDPLEMNLPLPTAVARLAADPSYLADFNLAYGEAPTVQTLTRALASFVRTLVSSNSRYDKHLRGQEQALSESEVSGMKLFFSKETGCFHCHSEHTLSNDGFFNNGSFLEGGDVGRQALTGRTGDLGKFRVPNLRNVEVTAPYMHDGSLATLEEVVEHYARGGRGHPSTDTQIEALSLSAEDKVDLVNFLKSLTDRTFLSDPRYRL